MTKTFWLKTMTLICFLLAGPVDAADSQQLTEAGKTQVIIIGTLHQFHFQNRHYRPEVLREILIALKPDAILNELPLSLVDKDGRPLNRERKNPECWAADQAAQQLHISQIPFDRPDRQEHFRRTRYFERSRQANELWQKWAEQLRTVDPQSTELRVAQLTNEASLAQAYFSTHAGPDIINSEAFDRVIRIKHSVPHDIMPAFWAKYTAYGTLVEDTEFIRRQWHERNQIMADNILRAAAQYPGKRLAVLTGCEHRYILRDILQKQESIDLKEYWQLVQVDPAQVPVYDDADKEVWGRPLSEERSTAHRELATHYWEAVISGDWERISELRPVLSAKQWAAKHKKNPPVQLMQVGQPQWQIGCGSPVTLCTLKFADGKVLEVMLVTDFRDVGGKPTGYIPATWGAPREVNSNRVDETAASKFPPRDDNPTWTVSRLPDGTLWRP